MQSVLALVDESLFVVEPSSVFATDSPARSAFVEGAEPGV